MESTIYLMPTPMVNDPDGGASIARTRRPRTVAPVSGIPTLYIMLCFFLPPSALFFLFSLSALRFHTLKQGFSTRPHII